eukprot:6523208-Ditylum_brightwellii.AAC.1
MEQMLGQILNLNQSYKAPTLNQFSHQMGMNITPPFHTPPPYMGNHPFVATPPTAMHWTTNGQHMVSLKNISPGNQNWLTTGISNH